MEYNQCIELCRCSGVINVLNCVGVLGYQLLPQEPGGHIDDYNDSDTETYQQAPMTSPIDQAVVETLNQQELAPPSDNSIYEV